MIFKVKRFSTILNAKGVDGRNYDQDLTRIQKGKVQKELNSPNIYNKELRKLEMEFNSSDALELNKEVEIRKIKSELNNLKKLKL
jgi:hypothetical protein